MFFFELLLLASWDASGQNMHSFLTQKVGPGRVVLALFRMFFLVRFLGNFFVDFYVFFDVPDIEFVCLFTVFWALFHFSFFSKYACKNASKKHRKSMKNLEKIWYKMATSTGIIKISSFFGLLPLPRPIWSHFGSHREAQNRRIMRQEQCTKKK